MTRLWVKLSSTRSFVVFHNEFDDAEALTIAEAGALVHAARGLRRGEAVTVPLADRGGKFELEAEVLAPRAAASTRRRFGFDEAAGRATLVVFAMAAINGRIVLRASPALPFPVDSAGAPLADAALADDPGIDLALRRVAADLGLADVAALEAMASPQDGAGVVGPAVPLARKAGFAVRVRRPAAARGPAVDVDDLIEIETAAADGDAIGAGLLLAHLDRQAARPHYEIAGARPGFAETRWTMRAAVRELLGNGAAPQPQMRGDRLVWSVSGFRATRGDVFLLRWADADVECRGLTGPDGAEWLAQPGQPVPTNAGRSVSEGHAVAFRHEGDRIALLESIEAADFPEPGWVPALRPAPLAPTDRQARRAQAALRSALAPAVAEAAADLAERIDGPALLRLLAAARWLELRRRGLAADAIDLALYGVADPAARLFGAGFDVADSPTPPILADRLARVERDGLAKGLVPAAFDPPPAAPGVAVPALALLALGGAADALAAALAQRVAPDFADAVRDDALFAVLAALQSDFRSQAEFDAPLRHGLALHFAHRLAGAASGSDGATAREALTGAAPAAGRGWLLLAAFTGRADEAEIAAAAAALRDALEPLRSAALAPTIDRPAMLAEMASTDFETRVEPVIADAEAQGAPKASLAALRAALARAHAPAPRALVLAAAREVVRRRVLVARLVGADLTVLRRIAEAAVAGAAGSPEPVPYEAIPDVPDKLASASPVGALAAALGAARVTLAELDLRTTRNEIAARAGGAPVPDWALDALARETVRSRTDAVLARLIENIGRAQKTSPADPKRAALLRAMRLADKLHRLSPREARASDDLLGAVWDIGEALDAAS